MCFLSFAIVLLQVNTSIPEHPKSIASRCDIHFYEVAYIQKIIHFMGKRRIIWIEKHICPWYLPAILAMRAFFYLEPKRGHEGAKRCHLVPECI